MLVMPPDDFFVAISHCTFCEAGWPAPAVLNAAPSPATTTAAQIENCLRLVIALLLSFGAARELGGSGAAVNLDQGQVWTKAATLPLPVCATLPLQPLPTCTPAAMLPLPSCTTTALWLEPNWPIPA